MNGGNDGQRRLPDQQDAFMKQLQRLVKESFQSAFMFRNLLHFAQIAAGAKSPSGSRQDDRASAMFTGGRKGEFQFAAHLVR